LMMNDPIKIGNVSWLNHKSTISTIFSLVNPQFLDAWPFLTSLENHLGSAEPKLHGACPSFHDILDDIPSNLRGECIIPYHGNLMVIRWVTVLKCEGHISSIHEFHGLDFIWFPSNCHQITIKNAWFPAPWSQVGASACDKGGRRLRGPTPQFHSAWGYVGDESKYTKYNYCLILNG
jgi:hypothetical protein